LVREVPSSKCILLPHLTKISEEKGDSNTPLDPPLLITPTDKNQTEEHLLTLSLTNQMDLVS
jgi:hypothetical protein